MSQWNSLLATGVPVPTGGTIPIRKEINDLSPEELYLYLEGLKKFQATSPDNDTPLSYFQIAGIHGRPYTKWPNQSWNNDIPRAQSSGFCTHSSILFLPWHRPYLALFESVLYKHVNEIANGINAPPADKTKYLAAAKDFRIPYWDWARRSNSSIFPQQALTNTNSSHGPPSSASVQPPDNYNPLYKYKFQTGAPGNITLGFSETRRWPNAGADAQTQMIETIKSFYKNPETQLEENTVLDPERNLTERVSYILLSYQRYGSMSYNLFRPTAGGRADHPENWGSLEDIHNVIHGLTGNGGQMNFPSVSAFDPIFWLHHTNIDRLFAIWQALHEDDSKPETYVTSQINQNGTWSQGPGKKEDASTLLYPFRDTTSSWYDSKKAKTTEAFGYAYPETAGLRHPTNPEAKANVERAIVRLYTPLWRMIRQSRAGVKNAGSNLLGQAHLLKEISVKKLTANANQVTTLAAQMPDAQTLLQRSLEPKKPLLKDLAPEDKYLEWLVNIKAVKHALGGDFSVHVFLGPVQEENVFLWPASPNHVGTFVTFGQDVDTECAKCQEDQANQVEVTGQIPLTLALTERYLAGILPNLTEDPVVEFLKTELHWRVAKSDGTIIEDRSQVDGLTVFVVSNEVTIPADEAALPVYADDVTIHPAVTTNLVGNGRGDGTGLTATDVPA